MAIEKAIEAADGRMIRDAYWTPSMIAIGVLDETGRIEFKAHTSAEARDAGKATIAGTQKEYTFSRDEFYAAQATTLGQLGIAEPTPQTTLYEVLARFAYGVAKTRKDVDTGEKDDDGKPIMRSFFEDGADV